jgi:predicted dehydrogenase
VADLMPHAIDILHYLLGPVTEVSALTKTFIEERPVAPAGAIDHFAVVEGTELGPVENEDYAGALVRFAGGAVGSCEVCRVTVGPRCQLAFDIYGTDGALSWDFERMNELRACLGRSDQDHGYRTVMVGPGLGDYASFQPGPAISMSYDDLKVVEAKHFLGSIANGCQEGATLGDASAAARVLDAVIQSAKANTWVRTSP